MDRVEVNPQHKSSAAFHFATADSLAKYFAASLRAMQFFGVVGFIVTAMLHFLLE